MLNLSCKVEIPKIQGLKDEELTVGREFYLNCAGLIPKNLDLEKFKIKSQMVPGQKESSEKSDVLKLKILESQLRDSSTVDIKVTSYLVGDHQFPNLIITDGAQDIDLGSIHFKVTSVLDPSGKPQKFGPIGPISLGFSVSYWILFFSCLLSLLLLIVAQILKIRNRKKIEKELALFQSPQTPIQQIYQTFRRLKRSYSLFETGLGSPDDFDGVAKSIEEAFRIYIFRQFKIPAHQWPDSKILKNFKKKYPRIYNEKQKEIESLFNEMAQIKDKKNQLEAQDVIQIFKGTQRLVDKMEEMGQ